MTIASNLSFLQNSAGAITTGTVNAIGSPITFSVNNTEYNRIDTNGYSLMGYTTSQGAYKLQVNGTIYASGSIIGNITGNVTGTVTTSSNVAGGTAGQLVYQSAPGITGFAGPGTSGQLLVSAGASAPVYTSTASIYVNSSRYSDNITAGTTGQLVYQSAANTTAFVGPGTSGQLLVSAGASAPVYTTTSTIQVGYAANILAGTTGQLVYQSAANTTGFVGPGTAGQFLQSAGAGAPTYVSTGTMYVQRAVQADSAVGGAGSVANALTISTGLSGSPSTSYNGSAAITLTLNTATLMANSVSASTATNAGTAYATIGTHTAGTGLSGTAFNGSANQTWTLNTATLMASSVAIAGGTTGQLVYQSAANTTGFVGPGTAGQFLQSAGASAPTYVSTTTMYVQRAVQADSASGASGSVANALTFNNGGSGSASGSTFNGSAAVTISYNSIGAPLASQLTNGAANGTAYNSIVSLDSRAVNYAPGDRSAGLFADFKANGTDSLSDGGGYHGVLTFRSYGTSNSDFTGGIAQQIAYTDNNNLWHRGSASSSTWGTWYKIIDTNNTSTALINSSVNIAGGTTGQLHYQSAANTTGFVGPGTAGQFLQSAGAGAPTYVSTGTMYVQRAVQADSASAGAGYTGNINATANTNAFEYIVGVSASGSTSAAATVATSVPVGFNASTGYVGIGTATPGVPLAFADSVATKIQYNGNNANGYTVGIATAVNSGDAMMKFVAGATGAGEFGFYNTTNLRLLINNSGNVGINNSSPSYRLDVTGSLRSSAVALLGSSVGQGDPSSTDVTANATLLLSGVGGNYLSFGQKSSNLCQWIQSAYSNPTTATYPISLNPLGGNVGIATLTPSAKLHVVIATPSGIGGVPSGTSAIIDNTGNNFLTFRNSSDNGTYSGIAMQDNNVGGFVIFGNAGGGGDQIYVAGYNGGSLQYGVTDSIAPRTTILAWTSAGTQVTGAGTFTGEVTAYSSDRRLKNNVQPIDNAVSKVLKLTGITYTWNDLANELVGFDTEKRVAGLFAQDVEEVLPEAVKLAPFDTDNNGESKSGEDYKTVQYEKLVPLLVEAIKEQQQQIAQLQQLVNQLVNK